IVCVVVAVLTSAQRADEVSLNREQQLLNQVIVVKGVFTLRQVESVAGTTQATKHLRSNDESWADRRIGKWLQNFYRHDVTIVVDGSDRVEYSLLRTPGDVDIATLAAQFAPILDLVRGRLKAVPPHTVPLGDSDPEKPGRGAVLIEHF